MCSHFESANSLGPLKVDRNPMAAPGKHIIWPGQPAPYRIGNTGSNSAQPQWQMGAFGLMPAWAKPTHYRHTYNARTETISSKPSFKNAWQRLQFCAVPVQRFFEPHYGTGKAQTWQIHRRDDEPFYLAGLWEFYGDVFGDAVHSFTLLTINATQHPIMQSFHGPEDEKRSVVVLPNHRVEEWLSVKNPLAAREFFVLFDPDEFMSQSAI